MDIRRRIILRHGLATVGLVVASGLSPPARAEDAAGWNPALFKATSLEAIAALLGLELRHSADVLVDSPDIAEIGAAVPVALRSTAKGVDLLGIAVPKNPIALVGLFHLEPGALPRVATRIKMAQSSQVYALARTGRTLLFNAKAVKVTVGGCG